MQDAGASVSLDERIANLSTGSLAAVHTGTNQSREKLEIAVQEANHSQNSEYFLPVEPEISTFKTTGISRKKPESARKISESYGRNIKPNETAARPPDENPSRTEKIKGSAATVLSSDREIVQADRKILEENDLEGKNFDSNDLDGKNQEWNDPEVNDIEENNLKKNDLDGNEPEGSGSQVQRTGKNTGSMQAESEEHLPETELKDQQSECPHPVLKGMHPFHPQVVVGSAWHINPAPELQNPYYNPFGKTSLLKQVYAATPLLAGIQDEAIPFKIISAQGMYSHHAARLDDSALADSVNGLNQSRLADPEPVYRTHAGPSKIVITKKPFQSGASSALAGMHITCNKDTDTNPEMIAANKLAEQMPSRSVSGYQPLKEAAAERLYNKVVKRFSLPVIHFIQHPSSHVPGFNSSDSMVQADMAL